MKSLRLAFRKFCSASLALCLTFAVSTPLWATTLQDLFDGESMVVGGKLLFDDWVLLSENPAGTFTFEQIDVTPFGADLRTGLGLDFVSDQELSQFCSQEDFDMAGGRCLGASFTFGYQVTVLPPFPLGEITGIGLEMFGVEILAPVPREPEACRETEVLILELVDDLAGKDLGGAAVNENICEGALLNLFQFSELLEPTSILVVETTVSFDTFRPGDSVSVSGFRQTFVPEPNALSLVLSGLVVIVLVSSLHRSHVGRGALQRGE